MNNNAITNGAGYTTNVGDITGVTAGAGMSGGGTSGTVTITNAAPNIVQTTVSGSSGSCTGNAATATNLTSGNKTISGNLTATGNVTAYSDRKLKDNLEVIPDALAKVASLTGYTYDRIDVERSRQSGIIAQDVQKVLPEVVTNHIDTETKEETLSVAYGNMVGLLIEAIKELKAEVEELKGNK